MEEEEGKDADNDANGGADVRGVDEHRGNGEWYDGEREGGDGAIVTSWNGGGGGGGGGKERRSAAISANVSLMEGNRDGWGEKESSGSNNGLMRTPGGPRIGNGGAKARTPSINGPLGVGVAKKRKKSAVGTGARKLRVSGEGVGATPTAAAAVAVEGGAAATEGGEGADSAVAMES